MGENKSFVFEPCKDKLKLFSLSEKVFVMQGSQPMLGLSDNQ